MQPGTLFTSSGRHFERAEQDPGARLPFVVVCGLAIIIQVIMNVAAVGLLLVASQSVSEPVGG